jgi:hypothetical protein
MCVHDCCVFMFLFLDITLNIYTYCCWIALRCRTWKSGIQANGQKGKTKQVKLAFQHIIYTKYLMIFSSFFNFHLISCKNMVMLILISIDRFTWCWTICTQIMLREAPSFWPLVGQKSSARLLILIVLNYMWIYLFAKNTCEYVIKVVNHLNPLLSWRLLEWNLT